LDTEITRLAAVRAAGDAGRVTAAATTAREALDQAATAVTTAEEREEKLRGEVAGAGDPTALSRLRDDHAERQRLATEARQLSTVVGTASDEHAAAAGVLDRARAAATRAHDDLERARVAFADAQAADRAAALRPHLAVGEPCPVCTQPVTALPAAHHESE